MTHLTTRQTALVKRSLLDGEISLVGPQVKTAKRLAALGLGVYSAARNSFTAKETARVATRKPIIRGSTHNFRAGKGNTALRRVTPAPSTAHRGEMK